MSTEPIPNPWHPDPILRAIGVRCLRDLRGVCRAGRHPQWGAVATKTDGADKIADEVRTLQEMLKAGLPVPRVFAHWEMSVDGDATGTYVMQRLQAKPLSQGRLSVACQAQIVEVLCALQRSQIVHGDLHHANVLHGPGGVYLIDPYPDNGEDSLIEQARDIDKLCRKYAPKVAAPSRDDLVKMAGVHR